MLIYIYIYIKDFCEMDKYEMGNLYIYIYLFDLNTTLIYIFVI